MTRVRLEHLSKQFGAHKAVDHLTLDVGSGEMVALLGPSGCGKTTTLRMICGLLEPTSGDVLFDEESVLSVRTEKRGAVMVFQKHLLFPTLTVAGNVGFGLKMQKLPRREIEDRVGRMLDLVRLPGMEIRKAHELSGGQQQRVALARALIVRPRVLLFDEPLANLDANLRIEMRELIRSIVSETGITSIFVTHDQEEAVMLADRVALILGGVLQQFGKPEDFYASPRSLEVARFFRNPNALRGFGRGSTIETKVGRFRVDPKRAQGLDGSVVMTVRPQDVQIIDTPDSDNCVKAEVVTNVYMGTHREIVVELSGEAWHVEGPVDAEFPPGASVLLRLAPEKIWVLPEGESRPAARSL